MVKGLEIFKSHFKDHADSFVIIGGTACSMLLETAGLEYRATKDIDMVLYIEILKPTFGMVFWDFIRKGGYKSLQKSSGKKIFFRFFDPTDNRYPYMLELFSSKPEGFEVGEGARLTPVPLAEEASSLSAILMDADYYSFIRAGMQDLDGLRVLKAEHLIPLKAKAFLDLSKRRQQGEKIDSDDIKKHKNDVFRLYPLLTAEMRPNVTNSIKRDMGEFLEAVMEKPINLKPLRIEADLRIVLKELRRIYGL